MSSCECVFKTESKRDVANSRHKHTCVLLQAHMPDLSTGLSRQLSPPCGRCGRTAGCPWVWMETYTSPTSTSTTLWPITAATLASPTGMSFSRRCPWLLRFSQVGVVVCDVLKHFMYIFSFCCHMLHSQRTDTVIVFLCVAHSLKYLYNISLQLVRWSSPPPLGYLPKAPPAPYWCYWGRNSC